MMRVFVPRTDFIERNIKYSVGCRLEGGRLWPRLVSLDIVFFYSEFWENINATDNARVKRPKLSDSCRRYAAFNKSPALKQVEEALPDSKLDPYISITGASNFMNFSHALTEESAKTFRMGMMVCYTLI